jgi:hypothetical protein
LGVDPLTERLMHWAMASWQRVEFLNRWLFGDLLPRLQMDMAPGLFCGAHLALLAPAEPTTVDDHLVAGRALQRFWSAVITAKVFDLPRVHWLWSRPPPYGCVWRQNFPQAAKVRYSSLDDWVAALCHWRDQCVDK